MVDWKRQLTWKLIIFFQRFFGFGWVALPSRPPGFWAKFWLGGANPPQMPPLNGRSSCLIEAAKRGSLDQMIFFSAPLTTRAPPTTVRPDVCMAGRPAGRLAERLAERPTERPAEH